MAHGYLDYYQNNLATIYSAGIETHGLNPGAVAIMKEDGVDIFIQFTFTFLEG